MQPAAICLDSGKTCRIARFRRVEPPCGLASIAIKPDNASARRQDSKIAGAVFVDIGQGDPVNPRLAAIGVMAPHCGAGAGEGYNHTGVGGDDYLLQTIGIEVRYRWP